jgi:peptide/nickel transport system substrate-binding protein
MTNEPDHSGTAGPDSPVDRYTTWLANRRSFLTLGGLAVGGAVIGVGAAGCGTAQTGNKGSDSSKGRAGAAGETLFVAGFQWGPPKSFNPLAASPDWPTAGGQSQLIYESLLRFNLIDGSLQPGLGKELQQPDDQTLRVPLQDGTKWSDGSDLTADDVAFTFGLGKTASVNFSTVWEYVDSITAVDPRTVEFKLKTKPYNPGFVKNFISSVLIVPKAVFGKISPDKIPAETNLKPIGSGPFLLDKYDQTQVNLKRNDNYWGKTAFGTPPMTTINHPIFKSNNDGDLKLESGEIDASQQFTAQIWKMWEAGKPVGTWMKKKPYHLPGNLPLLIFNLNKKGLDNLKVRQAIAYSINYPNIATTAMSDYSDPANASLIVPSGYESKFYDPGAVAAEGWKYDKAKAVDILENELKAKKGSDGIYVLPDGTKLGGCGPTGTPPARSSPSRRRRWASASPRSSRSSRPCSRRCRTATSNWRCTPTPASTRAARGSGSATPWTTGACRRPARRRSGTTTGSRTPTSRPCWTPRRQRRPTKRPRRRTRSSTRSTARTCRWCP